LKDQDLPGELDIPTALIRALGIEGITGRGVRVAVVDSGISDGHPHVGHLEKGVRIDQVDGGGMEVVEDLTDNLGHGTACAGVIRSIAPECDLISIKILDEHLLASSCVLIRAIRWVMEEGGCDLINLSLGTRNRKAVPELRDVCLEALGMGLIIVAAAGDDRRSDYPASFPGVVGVTSSDGQEVGVSSGMPPTFYASPYPRTIPGRRREENFTGPSFASARITGLIARMIEIDRNLDSWRIMGVLSRAIRSVSQR
jgi:subtilisin family serine protease